MSIGCPAITRAKPAQTPDETSTTSSFGIDKEERVYDAEDIVVQDKQPAHWLSLVEFLRLGFMYFPRKVVLSR